MVKCFKIQIVDFINFLFGTKNFLRNRKFPCRLSASLLWFLAVGQWPFTGAPHCGGHSVPLLEPHSVGAQWSFNGAPHCGGHSGPLLDLTVKGVTVT